MKDYFLFAAIFCLLVTVTVLTQGHWLSLLLLVLLFFRICATHKRNLLLGTLLLAVFIAFITNIHQWTNRTTLSSNEQSFFMKVDTATLKIDGDRVQFYGTVQATPTNQQVSEKLVVFYTLLTETEKIQWQSLPAEVLLKINGELSVPENNRNQYQFNYRSFLYRKKIHWILNAETIEEVPQSEPSILERVGFKQLRKAVLTHIDQRMTPKIASYVKTLLFADIGALDQTIMQNFKNIGIVHLLSISGLHIQFFLTGLVYCFWRIGVTKETTFYWMLLLLPFYGSLAGWGTSVYRSLVMGLILLASSHFRWSISSLDVWSWTLLSALVLNPYQIYSVGFQLSYLLSLVLLLLSSSFLNRSRPALITSLMISFLMVLVSIPILSFHFFEFSWIGVLTNLIFVPVFTWVLLPLFILLFFLSFILFPFPFYQSILHAVGLLIEAVEWLVQWFSKFPFAVIVTGRVPLTLTVLLTLSLIFFLITLEADQKVKKKRIYSVFLVAMTLFVFVFYQKYSPFGEVIIVDVGQGDAILMKDPFGKGHYLMDTGGSLLFEKEKWQLRERQTTVASRVLIPVLKSHGITSLDQVFISHGDEDHAGALRELAQTIRVKELLFPAGTTQKAAFRTTVLELAEKGTLMQEVLASKESITMLNQSLMVLWPFSSGAGENNDSMVVYGKIGSFLWLFTGDLEESGEKNLLKQYPYLRADILKVGHHGSQTSSSKLFIETLDPKLALISCGLNNRFKHPNEEVLQRIEEVGAKVYRTDLNGAIHYRYLELNQKMYLETIQTILK
ncbi:DNA internalization-related competence protein ComEC/Rec2 [Carnobacterium antarcticum]|uniref:DNA internalization-related competence protein ComEC/Rec2 n=1 Tax=Carnobacterium antarcticum TaxID=2126436 RepID=A0ABW4NRJ7_9LACT|nr:DNA internalization-related competence protein ComEC/Rec2 [Carnobacterium sp. CP1]ALV20902.1 Late competence protein ComEC, DNA transport [Carnobacterium sp. CP1]